MADNNFNQNYRRKLSDQDDDQYRNRPDSHQNQGYHDLDGDGFIGNTGGFYGGTSYLGSNYDDWNNNMNRGRMRRDDYGNEYDRRNQEKWQDSSHDHNRGYSSERNQPYQGGQQKGDWGNIYGSQSHRRYDDYHNDQENTYRKSSYGSGGNQQSSWADQRINRPHPGYGSNQYRNDKDYDNRRYERNDRQERSWWDRAKDEVSSWFDADNDDRRRRDSNVVGPHRGKGPRGYVRSAERIRDDINYRLSEDPFLDASDIEFEVNGNEVILKGNVYSREEKRRAEDLVEAISGVRHVENRLRVGRGDASGNSGLFGNASDSGSDERLKF